MSANLHANGGLLLKDLELPDFRAYAVDVPRPGTTRAEATRALGACLRDAMQSNRARPHAGGAARPRQRVRGPTA